jgi:hypothetical protein
MDNKICSGNTRDGSKCRVVALAGSDFCFFHDPSRAEQRRVAQSLGGQGNRMRILAEDTPDIRVECSADIIALICQTINQVRRGEVDPKIANSVGYLANIAMAAVERNDLEKRIQKLETLHERRLAALSRGL